MNDPVPVYGLVPPVAETVTVVDPPLQAMEPGVDDALTTAGSATVTDVVVEQLFASVIVNVYDPAVRVKEPVPEYGAVPPVADTTTVVDPPLHAIVPLEVEAASEAGGVMVPLVAAEHPFASVTLYE